MTRKNPKAIKVADIHRRLHELEDTQIAAFSQRFFKTGPGEYGEGDQFRGIRVPALRKLAREFQDLTLIETEELLHSSHHEDRLLALLILVRAYSKADYDARNQVFDLYLRNTSFINNWDLVDSSAEHIVGPFLHDRERDVLYRLAESRNLWERRISIMSTFHFIKRGEFSETLKIAQMLIGDKEDLIHKAVGWMLREIGNRDLNTEERFLNKHCKRMPRVMLRYAIEKFPEERRHKYLKGQI